MHKGGRGRDLYSGVASSKAFDQETVKSLTGASGRKFLLQSRLRNPGPWPFYSSRKSLYQADPFMVVTLIGNDYDEGFMVLQIPRSQLNSNDWFNMSVNQCLLILFMQLPVSIRERLVTQQRRKPAQGTCGQHLS